MKLVRLLEQHESLECLLLSSAQTPTQLGAELVKLSAKPATHPLTNMIIIFCYHNLLIQFDSYFCVHKRSLLKSFYFWIIGETNS